MRNAEQTGRHPRQRWPTQAGFSLLEVLVAFAIFAVSMGVLLQVFATGLRSVRLSAEYTRAALLAESVLAQIGVTEELEEGEDGDEIDERYRWRSQVTVYERADEDEQTAVTSGFGSTIPYRIDLDILWGEDQHPQSLRVTTLRLQAEQ